MTTAPLPEVAFDCPDRRNIVLVEGQPDPRDAATPVYAHDWESLLGQCRIALARRERSYPAMIASGTIEQAAADTDIEAWQRLVAEWTWITTGDGSPPPTMSLRIRREAVALALSRIDHELERGRRASSIELQQLLNQALAWHLDQIRFGEPAVHFCARFNHETAALRKENTDAQP